MMCAGCARCFERDFGFFLQICSGFGLFLRIMPVIPPDFFNHIGEQSKQKLHGSHGCTGCI